MAGISSQVNAARAATEWLRGELPTLTPEDWQTPNACGVWGVADSDEAGSDAVLKVDPQTYVLLFLGRLSWRRALEAGEVAVTGRRDAADGLPAWFGQS